MTTHPGNSSAQPCIICLPREISFSISHFSFLISHFTFYIDNNALKQAFSESRLA
ncbi:MAG: hypothetical protein NTX50_04370 [Candidatus Sumerlaeota bacterium]|nr:hypothetical protein [Candidatus Sumerlaeota bacterium]